MARNLQVKDLLARLDSGVDRVVPPAPVAERATEHASRVWTECGLPGSPGTLAYSVRTRIGSETLCHFETEIKDCFLIVIVSENARSVEGHLPFDIGAQYRPALFENLATGFVGEPTEAILDDAIPRLAEGETPAAILGFDSGTYMQTSLQGPDAYLLEYQTVTTAFHFALEAPVDERTVLWAFRSYAFGRYEWARELEWISYPL